MRTKFKTIAAGLANDHLDLKKQTRGRVVEHFVLFQKLHGKICLLYRVLKILRSLLTWNLFKN